MTVQRDWKFNRIAVNGWQMVAQPTQDAGCTKRRGKRYAAVTLFQPAKFNGGLFTIHE